MRPPPPPLQEAAGQMRRSPFQFSSIGSTSPTLWLTRGYAVLDGPTLPIVADDPPPAVDGAPAPPAPEPNDTFVEQLTGGFFGGRGGGLSCGCVLVRCRA